MAHSNNTISAPVDLVGDVAAVLEVNNYDLAYLCGNAHGKINKWAKYKPVRHTNVGELTNQQFADVMFGLTPGGSFSGVENLVNAVKDGSFKNKCGWSYNPPRPGTDWCRLTDFNGYNDAASSPFGTLNGITRELTNNSTVHFTIEGDAPNDNSEDNTVLCLKDFNSGTYPLQNYYFGVLLYYNASRYLVATSSKKFSEADVWIVDFGWINPDYAGTWKAYPFLSSAAFTVDGSKPTCTIVGIGNSGVDIVLKRPGSSFTIIVSCSYPSKKSGNVAYTVAITNNSGSPRTFRSLTIYVASNASGGNSTKLASFGDVTVANGAGWTKSGTVDPKQAYGFFNYCCVTYAGQTSLPWTQFEENDDDDS